MELHIYTYKLEYVGTIDTFISLRWREQVYETGEFELQCLPTAANLALFQTDYFIIREDRDECGIIEGLKISEAEGDILTVTGRLSKALTSFCYTDGWTDLQVEAGKIMYNIVEAFVRRVFNERVYNGAVATIEFDFGPGEGYFQPGWPRGEYIEAYQAGYRPVFDVLVELAKTSVGLYFTVTPDIANKRALYRSFYGEDRTINQSTNIPVVFSDVDGSLTNAVYENNVKNVRNSVKVSAKNKDGVWIGKTVQDYSRTASMFTRTIAVDASGILKPDDVGYLEFAEMMAELARQKLKELGKKQSMEWDVPATSSLQYRKDWNLGDLVTVDKTRWGVQFDQRIVEVEEVYDETTGPDGLITPVFGSPLPEKLKLGG